MMQSARKGRLEAGVGRVHASHVEKRMLWNSWRCRDSSLTPAGRNPRFFTITARTATQSGVAPTGRHTMRPRRQ